MEKHYRFAGVEITVYVPNDIAFDDEQSLAVFRAEQVTDPHRFEFELVDELIPPEKCILTKQPGYYVYGDDYTQMRYIGAEASPHIRAIHNGKMHYVQVKKGKYIQSISGRILLNSFALEHLIVRNRGFIFHCSYIEHNGKAILFTAPSGTGKSTQAELWAEHRGAKIINGDRAAVRLTDSIILAEGIPFAGSSKYCNNKNLPIQAIVYLGQASTTAIRKLRGYEAFSKIWEGISVNTWDKTDMELVSDVVQKVAESIPIYHLTCTPDESAINALEEVLRKQEIL